MEICNREGCTKPVQVKKRGLCKNHFQVWAIKHKPKGKKPCAVEGCTGHNYARGYCQNHYEKNRKYGQPEGPVREVTLCECGKEAFSKNKCKACYASWWYYNRPLVPEDHFKTLPQSHGVAHYRVRAVRGHANTHTCLDCGGSATDWSLKHDANKMADQSSSSRTNGALFSQSVWDYDARCRDCHKAYDAKHNNRRAGAYVREAS